MADGANNFANLNDAQISAVEFFDSPLLVLAGAGSGKTKVITEKISLIISHGRAMPYEILAVTFTNKAATEMKNRVQNLTGLGSDSLNIGTFHGIALKILRSNATSIGFTNGFSILDSDDQKKLMGKVLKSLGHDKSLKPQVVLSYISRVKEAFIQPSQLQYTIKDFPKGYAVIGLSEIYSEYQSELKRINSMDFDDLLFNSVLLFEQNPLVLQRYQELFKYILIDEYQDVNNLQQRFVNNILGQNQNITCVGDDDQSIYWWRGANVEHILSFTKHFKNAHIVKLEQNYRSHQHILSVAINLISQNKGRHNKTLWSDKTSDNKVIIANYETEMAESLDIATKIKNMISSEGREPLDFAILVRTSSVTRSLEEAMISESLPYRMIGGIRFYERREIKDILSYMKILITDRDDIASERALLTPRKGIGETSLDKIYGFAKERDTSILPALFELSTGLGGDVPVSGASYNAIGAFVSNLNRWRKSLKNTHHVDVIRTIISEISYERYLEEDDESSFDSRVENINELLNFLGSFESIADFFDYASLATSEDTASQTGVSIMTMHGSKGLEFPVVFLPSWNETTFPHAKTVDELGEMGIEEERRLAYVSITRAKEKLYISSSSMAMVRPGVVIPSQKSSFLCDIIDLCKDNIQVFDYSSRTSNGFSGGGYIKNQRNNMYGGYGKTKEYSETKPYVAKYTEVDLASELALGTRVKHKTFGSGYVAKVQGLLITVEFDDDFEKTIRRDFLTIL